MLIQDLLHIAPLGLLQMRCLQLTTRVAGHVPQVVLRAG